MTPTKSEIEAMRERLLELGPMSTAIAHNIHVIKAKMAGEPEPEYPIISEVEVVMAQAAAMLAALAEDREWLPIETAPRDRYFLAVALPERSEEKLIAAIFGDDAPAPRHLIVAHIRPRQRKGRVFASVTGQPFWASHWMDLPEMPE